MAKAGANGTKHFDGLFDHLGSDAVAWKDR
jgi:hypothetical protein